MTEAEPRSSHFLRKWTDWLTVLGKSTTKYNPSCYCLIAVVRNERFDKDRGSIAMEHQEQTMNLNCTVARTCYNASVGTPRFPVDSLSHLTICITL